MPLMKLDAIPHRQRRCWQFGALSLALHALLLGLGEVYLRNEPEIRFFSPDNAVSVSLVASGVRQGEVEAKEATEQREEAIPLQEEKSPPSVSPHASKVEKKKRSSPQKTRVEPKAEPAEVTGRPSESVAGQKMAGPSSPLGAVLERTIGEGDAPSFARFVPPEYPHQARVRNREGRVLLRVLVGAEGRAKDIEVLESSHPDFTKAARKSVQRSRYVPLMRQGRAEEVWVRIPFQFTLR